MNTKSITLPINALVGGIFLLISVTSLVQRAWLDVGTWAALGLAFLLIGANEQPWAEKPAWRRAGAVAFLLLGFAAFIARVVIDFSHR